MSNVKFKGIMPAIVSPLNEDGTVKENALRKQAEFNFDSNKTIKESMYNQANGSLSKLKIEQDTGVDAASLFRFQKGKGSGG